MIRRPPRYTRNCSSAASDVYKRQIHTHTHTHTHTHRIAHTHTNTHTNTHCQMTGSTVALKSKKRSHPTHCAIGAAGARPALCPVLQQTGVWVTARVHCLTVLSDTNTLCHTGPPTSIHCITLGTQPPTPIQPSTVSHWALSHQQPFSRPLYHTGHSATNSHSAIHCITLGTQPPTLIQLSTVSHWALSHQHPFSRPLYHTGHSTTNTHSAVHCITLGTQPPTAIQPSPNIF